jgi:glucosamine--fructose-6-phosphate aminotransferase (isomerizing)
MKHGSIALIEPDFLSVVCCPRDSVYEKTLSNVREIRSRGGPVIAMTSEGNEEIREHADETFEVPVTIEPLQPLLMAVPLQLLAYEVAIARRYDPDRPRNLAKSVTVE